MYIISLVNIEALWHLVFKAYLLRVIALTPFGGRLKICFGPAEGYAGWGGD